MGAIIMKIDFATLAFGHKIKVGGSTPNWATALGQGKEHKINNDAEIDELLKGMVYSAVPLEKVSTKIGKGGNVVFGNVENSPVVLAALFQKVYVNDVLIDDGKYILLITRDTSMSHAGRLRVKYGPSNTYYDNEDIYSNDIFIKQMKKKLGLGENACWFVSDINIRNQNELILTATIVNATENVEYDDTKALHMAWGKLNPTYVYSIDKQNKGEKNRIIFGAPGTGKSHKLEKDSEVFGDNVERVTFHPNYSFSQFVGTYKPVQGEKPGDITYEYVPGPFMRVYTRAVNNPGEDYLLIVEEINRANVAAVFGDIFQLLDRKDGVSEYPIATTEDIKKHLRKALVCLNYEENDEYGNRIFKQKDEDKYTKEDISKLLYMKIPENMYIWATMNSADQGVFPMDTAFKRRWEFEYLSVNDDEQVAAIKDYVIPMCFKDNKADHYIGWDSLRTRINNILTSEKCKVNEDKLLGPFFISKNMLDEIKNNKEQIDELEVKDEASRTEKDNEALKDMHQKENSYIKAFESKVIMYLFEDVMKMRPENIFIGHHKNNGKMIFSEICKAFEQDGEGIFGIEDLENI